MVRRAKAEAVFAFNQFAGATADIVEGCAAVRELLGRKYPLIIVDEFQDTDDDQWRIVAALSAVTTIFCWQIQTRVFFRTNERLIHSDLRRRAPSSSQRNLT